MHVFLDHIGCRLNEAELATWRRQLQARGHATVARLEDADVAVLNSCAVTAEAARDSRRRTRRLHRKNPKARLVLTGCFASLEPEQAAALSGVDLVVPNAQKTELVNRLLADLGEGLAPEAATEPGAPVHPDAPRTRAFVKIQDGCRNRCTFCIVTVARGEERSRSIDELVDEVNALHAAGHAEVVLTGVHIGGYGHERGDTLADLVDAVLARTTVPRVRIGSLEPWDLPDDLFERWQDPRMQPHLHLPLQSGSDPVLKRMARRCSTDRYRALVARARAAIPDLQLTTDLIVGFPGATDQDHANTLSFLEEMAFGDVHVFTYSRREGTAAARFGGHLDKATKKARGAEVHALVGRMRQAALQARVGQTRPVLFEGAPRPVEGGFRSLGYTDTFQRVAVTLPVDRPLEGHVLPVRLDAVDDGARLRGTLA
jgi:threonylcarbamoyladenosine tRNA methylthiotransferase MtaB